jgi:S-adenosylmethionine hydrolase
MVCTGSTVPHSHLNGFALLAADAVWFPPRTVFLCIVDPGVGGTRPSIFLEADGRWYVGPGISLSNAVRAIGRQS